MPKVERTSKKVASAASRVLKEPKNATATSKSLAGSALTQNPSMASARSRQVISEVSSEHSEALKRLVNR